MNLVDVDVRLIAGLLPPEPKEEEKDEYWADPARITPILHLCYSAILCTTFKHCWTHKKPLLAPSEGIKHYTLSITTPTIR